MKEFLVEIRFKDWVHVPAGESRAFTYVEVLAHDEFHARHTGFNEFERLVKYSPILRRKFEEKKLSITEYCAPDAVEI